MGLVMSGKFDSIEDRSFVQKDGNTFNYTVITLHDPENKSYDELTLSRPEDVAAVRRYVAGKEGKQVQFRVRIRDNGKVGFHSILE